MAQAMKAGNASKGGKSMSPGLAPAHTAMPAPIFDQLQISIWNGLGPDIILPVFINAFGKPWYDKEDDVLIFKKGIISMHRKKMGYRVIRFSAIESLLKKLIPVLQSFPSRNNGKPAAQLRSAEIAWDFPVSVSANYEEAEEQLQKIVAVTVSVNSDAKYLRQESSDYFFMPRDGAVNGLITFYFQSLSEDPEPEDTSQDEAEGNSQKEEKKTRFSFRPSTKARYSLLPSKKAIWSGRVYCKRPTKKMPWCIRFEVKLPGSKLAADIGKFLPVDLTTLPRRLERLRFDDYWRFEQFHWSAFMEAVRLSAASKGFPFVNVEKRTRVSYPLSRLNGLDITIAAKVVGKKHC